jgi:hypothetical protein
LSNWWSICFETAHIALTAFGHSCRSVDHQKELKSWRHIPDRFEHLVRYFGWYSTRVRGERARKAVPSAVQSAEDGPETAARARSAWARLIHKVYEVDPLQCPKCGAPMHVIALIDDAAVIRRILEHLGRWAPREVQRNPRAPPKKPSVPELTYHPVPDIA